MPEILSFYFDERCNNESKSRADVVVKNGKEVENYINKIA